MQSIWTYNRLNFFQTPVQTCKKNKIKKHSIKILINSKNSKKKFTNDNKKLNEKVVVKPFLVQIVQLVGRSQMLRFCGWVSRDIAIVFAYFKSINLFYFISQVLLIASLFEVLNARAYTSTSFCAFFFFF